MRRKITVTLFIVFSAFMLNVSAMAFQQRYDRREDEDNYDPHVIEMTDMQVLKYLKNTWFCELPLNNCTENKKTFIIEEIGFGHQYTIVDKSFQCCQLKFVLINYMGLFAPKLPEKTFEILQI